jgi:preprotein translocase subunit SecD
MGQCCGAGVAKQTKNETELVGVHRATIPDIHVSRNSNTISNSANEKNERSAASTEKAERSEKDDELENCRTEDVFKSDDEKGTEHDLETFRTNVTAEQLDEREPEKENDVKIVVEETRNIIGERLEDKEIKRLDYSAKPKFKSPRKQRNVSNIIHAIDELEHGRIVADQLTHNTEPEAHPEPQPEAEAHPQEQKKRVIGFNVLGSVGMQELLSKQKSLNKVH